MSSIDDALENDRQLVVAESLPPDLMLLKMENESMMSVARKTPRNPAAIVAQLTQLIDAFPAAAEEAIYRKPVGSVYKVLCSRKGCGIEFETPKVTRDSVCPACGSPADAQSAVKSQKFAEGLSIRAAESIRSIYGCTRMATTCTILPDGKAEIGGTFVDYAACNMSQDTRIVSPYYKAYDGSIVKTPEDRFLGVVVKAEKAKLRRDLILDNVDNMVKAMFRDLCEQKMLALVTPEYIDQKIVPGFSQYGITRDDLAKIVGRPPGVGWTQQDNLNLRKIFSSLKNEETTAAEVLAGLNEPKAAANGATAAPKPTTLDQAASAPIPGKGPQAAPAEPTTTPVAPADTAPDGMNLPAQEWGAAPSAETGQTAPTAENAAEDPVPGPLPDAERQALVADYKARIERTIQTKRLEEIRKESFTDKRLTDLDVDYVAKLVDLRASDLNRIPR